MNRQRMIVVDGFVPAREGELDDVRGNIWSFAMDQRAFGPRKLWVVFADAGGQFRGLAYTDREGDPLLGLEACLDYLGAGADAAVVLCDEPVSGPGASDDLLERLTQARTIGSGYGIHIVDWIACDDDQFRAARLATLTPREQPEWWAIPSTPRSVGPHS